MTNVKVQSQEGVLKKILIRIKRWFVRKYYFVIVLKKLTLNYRPCVLCANNDDAHFKTLYSKDRYGFSISTMQCENCGLVQTRPTPTPQFIDWFYATPAYRGLYIGIRSASKGKDNDDSFRRAEIHSAFIEKLSVPVNGSVLDFGSADGEILLALKHKRPDITAYGLEPGANFSHVNSRVFDGFFSRLDDIPAKLQFDLITAWHVFEHLYNPVETLQALTKHLKPDGRIAIEVPSFSRYVGIRPIHIGHLHHFDRDTMEQMAAAAGLIVEMYTTDDLTDTRFGMKIVMKR